MDLSLLETPAVGEFRAQMRRFAETELAPQVEACERARDVPLAVKKKLVAQGCFGRTIPSANGGIGGSIAEYVIQQEELARVWVSAAAITSAPNLACRILLRFGSDDMKGAYVSKIANGDVLTAVAFTEPEGGSDVASIRTTAEKIDGGFRLRGAKRLIDNTGSADVFIVLARTDADANPPHRGLSLFLVSRDTPGFDVGGVYDILGMRPVGVGWLELRDCVVPDTALIGDLNRGFYEMMAMVEFGRTNVAAICTGIADGALEEAKRFAVGRRSFGSYLSANQVIQSKVADMAVSVDASRLLTYRAAAMLESGARCDREASIAKLFASEAATRVTADAMQMLGGIGFTSEYQVERMFRDSRMFTIGEGTSEIQRMIIGRREFEDLTSDPASR